MVCWPTEWRQSELRGGARERLGANLQRAFPMPDCGSFEKLLQAVDEAQLAAKTRARE
jgi:hypothetical protein